MLAVLVALLLPFLQLVISALLPAFTRRAQRCIASGFWPCAGWGALSGLLIGVVAGIFSSAGGAAQTLAASLGIGALVLAIAGGVGTAKLIGDWALARWGLGSMGPLSVLVGSAIWLLAAVLPGVGWAAGILSLIASLGVAVQVLLSPRAFDESSGPRNVESGPEGPAGIELLSVIIPVYNEESTVREVIERVKAVPIAKEIIVVDDGSTDGTQQILRAEDDDQVVTVYTSPTNFGKGAAIRIGLTFATGDAVIIQDADLELDPEEYPRLLEPIQAGETNVVYGSRFLQPAAGLRLSTRLANRLLALWCNLLYWSRLTDVATAYKVFRLATISQIELKSVGFEFCAEVTAGLLRRGETIVEVPIGYHPRSTEEGKKLNYLRDGANAAWWLLWLRFSS